MKKVLLTLFVLGLCVLADAQVLRPFTVRYYNPSAKGNIIQVANNIYTSVGGVSRTTNPGNTTEAPPGGASRNNGTPGRSLNLDALIPFGSTWRYLAASATRPAGWSNTVFADGAWPSNSGEFGYGDGDEVTCIPSGGGGTTCVPTGTKVITTYFRKTFNIPNHLAYTSYQFKVERDDGYVLYLNGAEVSRNNMPAGAVAHGTVASADVNDAIITFTLPNTAFVSGNNVIAVEIHQRTSSSDDLSFDMELTGLTGTSADIFNSSTADLNLPSCTQVLFAGLYWGATQGVDGINTGWITNEANVKLKLPGSATYLDLVSTQTDYHNDVLVPGLPHTGYRCFRDITSIVNATNPNGTYGVANVAVPENIINGAAGWTIVIVYADPATIVRNLTVFDGSAIMNGGDPPLNVPITGFLTPPSGPVSCELGAVVYDGDRTSTDAYMFKQDANPLVGTYTDLTPNATSSASDMWNSTISRYGANVTTRNPAHRNTLGYDADVIIVPNAGNAVLGNNATSASLRFASPSENYFIHTISTAISQYTPTFALSKTSLDVNGGSLLPGEALRYQVNFVNGGNDASTNTTIYDNIPVGTSYKPGSLLINGVTMTDASGDDQAEYDFVNNRVVFRLGTGANSTTGGEVAVGGSGNISFEVYTANSCAVLTCNSSISNRARISYAGKLSLLDLYDSSGVISGGCIIPIPVTNNVLGSCAPLGDTVLANVCPSTSVLLPIIRYAGYVFHTGIPFTPANRYNPSVPVTITRVIYAYYDGPGSCDDTIRLNIFITACPDIDDDNDGIPDYVELNNPLALANHDGDAFPNWNDNNYPGFVDNNSDGFNDNFDPSADSDNDGNPNFYDNNFPGWVDSNADGVNDSMDKDLDGIPNHLDLDSDNDGIPDTVESFGVDANGDGRIDNYTDTDNDGLSQNVDGSAAGVTGSGVALGALDTDGDGIPNYLDKDSDNDGIPDNMEVFGTDSDNDGKQDGFVDLDGDGYGDSVDGDVGNDAVAENMASSLLRTSSDGNNDGRADSWPYKNMDNDTRANPYDLDSDGDGVADVREAQFIDGNYDGRVDGAINSDGWNVILASMGSLPVPNTDGTARSNPYDIDADDDGIPDNVEGLTTLGYLLPSGADTDQDGIDNSYDNFSGFGGDGIHPVDTDSDTTPDYLDSDTDSDGVVDIIEGNDFNFNGLPDDLVTLTGIDTDGDGLDNRFDNNNSTAEATSAYMGNGGTTSGDPTPGSITTVQHTSFAYGCLTERDWRCLPYILSCNMITFTAVLHNQVVQLDWSVYCKQAADRFVVERSTDRQQFTEVVSVTGRTVINEVESYSAQDNINGLPGDMIYYRLRTIEKNGTISFSNIVAVTRNTNGPIVRIIPNVVTDQLQLQVYSATTTTATVMLVDATGKVLRRYSPMIHPGTNTITYADVSSFPAGMYYLRLDMSGNSYTRKFTVIK